MKTILLLAVAAIAACQLQAQCPATEYTLSKDGIGPFTMRTCVQVEVKGKEVTFTASARNDSGLAIRHADWCIRAYEQKTGCAFTFSIKEPWLPGTTVAFDGRGPNIKKGLPHHWALVANVSPATSLDPVRKLFVDKIDGPNGEMSRQALQALITTSGRFQLVVNRSEADAVIVGGADKRDAGSTFSGVARAAGVGSALGGRGSLFGIAATNSVSHGATQTIIAETLVLRMVLPSGESIWAWDDTKSCLQSKTACAIWDLTAEATK